MWDWDFAFSILPDLGRGLWITLQAVFWGMLLALTVGLAWAVARRSRRRLVSWPVHAVVEFVRSTPLLVQLYFFYYVPVQAGMMGEFMAGVIALGLHYSCYTAEVYRAGIEGVDRGQWEAARALNLTRRQTYRHVVLPQAIPPILPALGNYLIAMFKDTPLLSAITIMEILRRATIIGKETFRYVEPMTIVGVAYLVLSLLSSRLVGYLERRLDVDGGGAHA